MCAVMLTAVPEKLKDYSEHHAMYAPRRKLLVCGSAPCTVPKSLPATLLLFSTHRTYHFPDRTHRGSTAGS